MYEYYYNYYNELLLLSFKELNRLRRKNISANDNLSTIEIELRNCKEQLERALADKENLQRQAAGHILEIDKLKQV